jgi:hypothetical protein
VVPIPYKENSQADESDDSQQSSSIDSPIGRHRASLALGAMIWRRQHPVWSLSDDARFYLKGATNNHDAILGHL